MYSRASGCIFEMIFYLVLVFSLPTYIERPIVAMNDSDFCQAMTDSSEGTVKGFQINLLKGTIKSAHCEFTQPKVVVTK
jgi:hypothetical protein